MNSILITIVFCIIFLSLIGVIYFSIELKNNIKRHRVNNTLPNKYPILTIVFNLAEVLFLVALSLFMMLTLYMHFFGIKEPPQKAEWTKIQLGQLANALTLFYSDCGKLPSEEEWPNALITPDLCQKGVEHYTLQKKISDGWGRDIIYKVYSDHAEIKSYGRDGKEGGQGLDEDLVIKVKLDGTQLD